MNTVSLITRGDGHTLFIDKLPGTHLSSEELNGIKKKLRLGRQHPRICAVRRIQEIKDELFKVIQAIPDEKLFAVREE